MKRFVAALLLLSASVANVCAAEGIRSVPAGCELVGVIHVNPKGQALDAKAMREVDALIPRLKKDFKGKLIRVEGGYASSRGSREYVRQSMHIARKVEQYLQKRKAFAGDLFIAAMDDKLLTGGKSVARIVLYPNDFALEQLDCPRDLTEKMKGQQLP